MENSKTHGGKCYTNEMYQEAERKHLTMEEEMMKEREEIHYNESKKTVNKIKRTYQQMLERESENLTDLQSELEKPYQKQANVDAGFHHKI